MLKRIAGMMYRLAYGVSIAVHDEVTKAEWLEKGFERGQAAKKIKSPFNLYLVPTQEDDAGRRSIQRGSLGELQPDYTWWGTVDPATGQEVALGQLSRVSVEKAIGMYLGVLTGGALESLKLDVCEVLLPVCDKCGLVIQTDEPHTTKVTHTCMIHSVVESKHMLNEKGIKCLNSN